MVVTVTCLFCDNSDHTDEERESLMRLRPGSVFAVKEDLSEDGKVDHDLKTTANNELGKNRINWLSLFSLNRFTGLLHLLRSL
jgi:hypothetical protein